MRKSLLKRGLFLLPLLSTVAATSPASPYTSPLKGLNSAVRPSKTVHAWMDDQVDVEGPLVPRKIDAAPAWVHSTAEKQQRVFDNIVNSLVGLQDAYTAIQRRLGKALTTYEEDPNEINRATFLRELARAAAEGAAATQSLMTLDKEVESSVTSLKKEARVRISEAHKEEAAAFQEVDAISHKMEKTESRFSELSARISLLPEDEAWPRGVEKEIKSLRRELGDARRMRDIKTATARAISRSRHKIVTSLEFYDDFIDLSEEIAAESRSSNLTFRALGESLEDIGKYELWARAFRIKPDVKKHMGAAADDLDKLRKGLEGYMSGGFANMSSTEAPNTPTPRDRAGEQRELLDFLKSYPREAATTEGSAMWARYKLDHDNDVDGIITPKEWTRAPKRFNELDSNKDGLLTANDFGPQNIASQHKTTGGN